MSNVKEFFVLRCGVCCNFGDAVGVVASVILTTFMSQTHCCKILLGAVN